MNPTQKQALLKAARTWLPEVAIILLVLIALRRRNPSEYYLFLRWMVCPAMAWIAWKAYGKGTGLFMVIAAGILAVLFNPLIRVVLSRERWEILNIALIAVAIWSLVASLKSEKQEPGI